MVSRPVGDPRLGHVIDDETDLGERACHLECRGQLARADQKVVDEPRLANRLNSSLDVLVQEPFFIVLVMNLMPDPDQVMSAGFGPELGQSLGD